MQSVQGSELMTSVLPLPRLYPIPLLSWIQWHTGIQTLIKFILPGKGCKGTTGFWQSKRHTTGGGMERPGGSQCPGVQALGVQGKGKGSGGRLSIRGPWEFSCKGRTHMESGARLGKKWVYSRMRVGLQNLRAWRAVKSHPLILPWREDICPG